MNILSYKSYPYAAWLLGFAMTFTGSSLFYILYFHKVYLYLILNLLLFLYL